MNRKQLDIFRLILERIRYLFSARYRKGHGVHSPIVYEFVSKVLYNKKNRPDYSNIEKLVKSLKTDSTKIDFIEMGGGSRVFAEGSRSIQDIISKSAVSKKYGRLLYRLVEYYKPELVLEIGTSLGIGTLYLAMGEESTIIHTIEGNRSAVEKAIENAQNLDVKNINFHCGNFDEVLPKLLNSIGAPIIAYVDGNHTYDATLNYYHQLKSKMNKGIIVFDDIYWSHGMQEAWKKIANSEPVVVDIFQFGIVILGDRLTPGNYRVRY